MDKKEAEDKEMLDRAEKTIVFLKSSMKQDPNFNSIFQYLLVLLKEKLNVKDDSEAISEEQERKDSEADRKALYLVLQLQIHSFADCSQLLGMMMLEQRVANLELEEDLAELREQLEQEKRLKAKAEHQLGVVQKMNELQV